MKSVVQLELCFVLPSATQLPTKELLDCLFDHGRSPSSPQSGDGLQPEKSRSPGGPGLSPLLQVGSVALHRPGRCGLPHGSGEGYMGGPVVGTEEWDQLDSGGASSVGAAIWSLLCGGGGGVEGSLWSLILVEVESLTLEENYGVMDPYRCSKRLSCIFHGWLKLVVFSSHFLNPQPSFELHKRSHQEASLVFLGTDEGDVRAFDAGDHPHMASYCIPCTALYGRKDRPCPVAALGASPGPSSCEVVIANGEGGLLLWSFEKHRAVRSFDSMSGVTSILWCRSGSHFLAASRSDISLFSRSSSSALARITLPGGSAQGVSLLHWDAQMTSETTALSGDLWLRRGAPNPSLQRLSGENWSRADTVMQDVMGATAFRPSALQTRPCGCPAMPSTTLFSENHDLTMTEVAMVAVTSGGNFMVAGASKTYPLTWGSLPLANFSCMELLPSRALQAPEPAPAKVDVDAPVSRQWAVCNGELKDAIAMPPTESRCGCGLDVSAWPFCKMRCTWVAY